MRLAQDATLACYAADEAAEVTGDANEDSRKNFKRETKKRQRRLRSTHRAQMEHADCKAKNAGRNPKYKVKQQDAFQLCTFERPLPCDQSCGDDRNREDRGQYQIEAGYRREVLPLGALRDEIEPYPDKEQRDRE